MGRISPKPVFASQTWVTTHVSGSVIPDDQSLQEVCDFGATTTVPITVSTSGSSFASSRFTGDIDTVNHNIIHLADPTFNQDAATKKYIDDTSGSIGTDLNNQVSNVREYTDTVSGSIGTDLNHQIITARAYTDQQVCTIDTLDEVVKNGSYTDHGIQVDASGSAFHSLTVASGSIDMADHTIVNVANPVNAQDVSTKAYVSTVSGSIGVDLNSQVSNVKAYTDDEIDTASGSIGVDLNHQILSARAYTDTEIDIVSGSIGVDLNDQVHKVREYTDTVSGSIGTDLNNQVSNLREYTDIASGSCAQSLQSVTDIGNSSSNAITIGDAVNYTEIKADGEINLHGTARVTGHIRVPAPGWSIGASAPTAGLVGVTRTLDFDNSIDDEAYYSLITPYRMVSGSAINVEINWCYTGAQDDGTVCWGLDYTILPSGSVVAETSATITGTSSVGQMTGRLITTTLATGITGATSHDTVSMRFYRDESEDTLATDAQLVLVHFHFTEDKLGEAT